MTINELIKYFDDLAQRHPFLHDNKEFKYLRNNLVRMKNAPELKNSCNIDFKIDNPDYYLNKVASILNKDGDKDE
ncbi:MAG: hypothetical protein ACOCQ4_01020 [bacterium]